MYTTCTSSRSWSRSKANEQPQLVVHVRVGYFEARGHATLVAAIFWLSAVLAYAIPGDRYLIGGLKAPDFVQVYTLASIAFREPYPTVARLDSFQKHQAELVPASANDTYLPVYPPVAALIFAPFAKLPYVGAATTWVALSLAIYALIAYLVWRTAASVLPDRRFVGVALAAFPPAWFLVIDGQVTILPLIGLYLSWEGLRRERFFFAGLATGLLTVKPQLGIILWITLFLGGPWRAVAGSAVAMLTVLAAVVLSMGNQAVSAYASTLAQLPAVEHLLEPAPWRMHSLRTLTNVLPPVMSTAVWGVSAALVVAATLRTWRSTAPVAIRFSVVVLATVLVNPHMFVYDTTVLVLPLILLGAWIEEHQPSWRIQYWQATYLLCVTLLIPTALWVGLQASVFLMLWIFWRVVRLRWPAYAVSGPAVQHVNP
jgi:hypothetical protein